jgi:ribonuclease III
MNVYKNIYDKLLCKLEYYFKNINLLKLALTHKSVNNHVDKNNERLELLGDVILNSIVTIYLLDKLPNINEGGIVKLKSLIVSKRGLSKIANYLNLYDFILFKSNKINFNSDKVLSSFVESLFGSIFLDNNDFILTKNIFLKLLKKCKDEILNDSEYYDYKSFVQVKVHELLHFTPTYILIDKFLVNNKFFFKIELEILKDKFVGISDSKIKAEQLAAKKCCIKMKWKINNFYDDIF